MAEKRSFSVVVAICKHSHGIGHGGQLPWRLRSDMAFFKQLTRSTRDPLKRNAVIMGRKTWESIPPKFRPLDDRVNIVLSRNPSAKSGLDLPPSVLVAESLEGALGLLGEGSEAGKGVESIFVIGGGAVYAEAVALRDVCAKIYTTQVERVEAAAESVATADAENAGENAAAGVLVGGKPAANPFDCDVFFPELPADLFEEVSRTATHVEVSVCAAHRTPCGTARPALPEPLTVSTPRVHAQGSLRYEFVTYIPKVKATGPSASLGAAVHEEDQYLALVREVRFWRSHTRE